MCYQLGIDAGSTTLKLVLLNQDQEMIYQSYDRHYSKIKEKLVEEIINLQPILEKKQVKVCITGSAGYGISKQTGIPFVQEVYATTYKLKRENWNTDVVIELGGEDAKIIYLTGGLEERMNSTCAGGTGAFIDQMASLMDVSTQMLDELSLQSENIYQIASRCGVFAKSDIQPLLNQGASKVDLSASIFQAVVDQTITGLAQGRKIKGRIMFLGGPLHYYKGLRKRFIKTLKLDETSAVFPAEGQYFVALGCALYSQEKEQCYTYDTLQKLISKRDTEQEKNNRLTPLFENQESYYKWLRRHHEQDILTYPIEAYSGKAYLGIDAGSTTTKMILMDEGHRILYQYYASNKGNPVEVVKEQLKVIYELCGESVKIVSTGVTGYGEELIRSGFNMDFGIVETVAHLTAAQYFKPNVTFILDIGGQDIKCFKLDQGKIENIILNEACSSGCGSFIETFARQMGCSVEEFVQLALAAKHPVDLGSRCTVFMNSSVKEAQKDGASLGDVSSGLAISVVKNALYKVIRAHDLSELGEHIVVQGGTLYNDAILRALELELGREVTRPNIAGLMGAFGVALYAQQHSQEQSHLISRQDLMDFKHESSVKRCQLCSNHCNLIINKFNDKRMFISGNRCERPQQKEAKAALPNLYAYKYHKLRALGSDKTLQKVVGIPLVMNMYELLPFWTAFFETLGIGVVLSDTSNKKLYAKGQHSIPSDTVCYPAKLAHGHVINLIEQGVTHIFYPCMSYNLEEGIADNCFNCPVVAYYPELLNSNIEELSKIQFIQPYITLNHEKTFIKTMQQVMRTMFGDFTRSQISQALKVAKGALETYKAEVREEGKKAMCYARDHQLPIVVLAGRPYHIDPEINHGIDQLIGSLGAVVISEDCLYTPHCKPKVKVLNQWTYQARLYCAAEYVASHADMEMIHLVSFGCGTDAITADEVKDLLQQSDRMYTQLKIDETSNLGAAKIRIRSMFASASGSRERQ
ncbi:MAG: acyl-CoA dehydratase activase-related protein [Cellulosilyticaceae bacterium]